MLNICHVITRLIVGGAQENTILTCRGLVQRGHRVTLIAGPETGPEGSLWVEAQSCGAELISLPSLRRAVRPISDVQARADLRRIFSTRKPDVVHTHSSKAGVLARSAAAAAGVPTIVHTIHGMSFNRTQAAPVRWAYRLLERRAARHTHAFVTVADAMIDQAVQAGLGKRERFTTIRSGLDTERYRPSTTRRRRHRQELGAGDDDVVVGTIARLFVNKGYEDILEAMPRMVSRDPRLRFVWIGDGKYRRRYERRLDSLGMRDRVRLLGLVSPDHVASCLGGFDVLLHASRWEGLPRAVVQGLLTEVPAVSYDNDGAPEVVIPGRTGVIVPYGDRVALANAVVELASDGERRHQLGKNGRCLCLNLYDWQGMVEQLETMYVNLTTLSADRQSQGLP